LRLILDDFEANGNGASFTDYYEEKGQLYFYDFLKPLTDTDNLTQDDFIDWGNEEKYKQEIGIGECAGVIVDLVATLFLESQEKIEKAEEALQENKWAASIYYSYQSIVNSAKALLTSEKVKTNTHASIVKDFDELYVESGKIAFEGGFANIALQLNKNEPSEAFAKSYLQDAKEVLQRLEAFRKIELQHA
jgi:sulfite reductase (ferredoxin)